MENKVCQNSGTDIILLICFITIIISKFLTPAMQVGLGNFLMSLGQNLATISQIQSTCISNIAKNNEISQTNFQKSSSLF